MAAPRYSKRTRFLVATIAATFSLGTLYDLLWLPFYEPVWRPIHEYFAGAQPRFRDPIEETPYEVPQCANSASVSDVEEDELRRIFKAHENWLEGKPKHASLGRGARAVLCFADLRPHASLLLEYDLRKAILIGVNLEGARLFESGAAGKIRKARLKETDLGLANLRGANLERAVLTGADLTKADLSYANLERAKLNGKAELREANFTHANLKRADLRNGHFDYANLRWADLRRADARKTNFFTADFEKACLYRTNLSNTRLKYAKFGGAILWEADLKGARLSRARLAGAVFEPVSLPDVKSLFDAEGLEDLRSAAGRMGGLAALRAALATSGLRQPEREVAYALERERTYLMFDPNLGETFATRRYPADEHSACGLPDFSPEASRWPEAAFRLVFFQWLFGYGFYYETPLALLWLSVVFFAIVYFRAVRRETCDAPAIVKETGPDRVEIKAGKLSYATTCQLEFIHYKCSFWDPFVFSLYFSVMSTLHFGVPWLDFGKWIARLQKESYSVFGLGVLRFYSGLQSVLGLSFLSIFIISYFGRPLH